jgi:phosphoesterase RecJ-like protein
LGKEVTIINHNPTPYNIQFLDPENVIKVYDRKNPQSIIDEVDVIIFLDLNQQSRVASMYPKLKELKKIKIVIDHHQDPEDFADFTISDTKANATGEIIYDFISETRFNANRLRISTAALCCYYY